PLEGEGGALRARRLLAESSSFCREKDYAAALDSSRRCLGLFGGNPPLSELLARALRAEGNALVKDGGPEDSRAAISSFEREVSVRSRLEGLESRKTLEAMFRLALAMEKVGRDKHAMALHVKVLEARRRVMGNKAPETGQSREAVEALQNKAGAEAEEKGK
ncbi:MAG: hypothetical protein LBQ12_04715, partial [Deltaproteobacteria bacterium]|nr:hypothetical protein [Deltaproteobacteria bacterium]